MRYDVNIDNDSIIHKEDYLQQSFYQFLIYTRSARIRETSSHLFIFIQILVIDLDPTILKELGRLTV